jgi:arylsulfatase A-like enzyme
MDMEGGKSQTEERMNILLIMTDQQRYDTLGCYGATTCRTPNVDAIAARGVRFDRAYTPTSPCTGHIFPTPLRFVRTRTHKLVYNRSDIGELYDLVNDPWEMRNLIDLPETSALQDGLLEQIRDHMVQLEDPMLGPFDRIRSVY